MVGKKDLEFRFGLKVKSTKENLSITKCMEEAVTNGKMADSTKETG